MQPLVQTTSYHQLCLSCYLVLCSHCDKTVLKLLFVYFFPLNLLLQQGHNWNRNHSSKIVTYVTVISSSQNAFMTNLISLHDKMTRVVGEKRLQTLYTWILIKFLTLFPIAFFWRNWLLMAQMCIVCWVKNQLGGLALRAIVKETQTSQQLTPVMFPGARYQGQFWLPFLSVIWTVWIEYTLRKLTNNTKLDRTVDLFENRKALHMNLSRLNQWAESRHIRPSARLLHLRHNNTINVTGWGKSGWKSAQQQRTWRC